jgi:hypothetical protein
VLGMGLVFLACFGGLAVLFEDLLNNQRHPDRFRRPSMLLWIPVWMKPPIMVPARPDAVKMPERFPSSFSVYQDPRM